MKVGDLVVTRKSHKMTGYDYGIGIIVDEYYNDNDCRDYFKVMWEGEANWWAANEIVLIKP